MQFQQFLFGEPNTDSSFIGSSFGDFVSVRGEGSEVPYVGFINDGRQCTIPEDGSVEVLWMYRQVLWP